MTQTQQAYSNNFFFDVDLFVSNLIDKLHMDKSDPNTLSDLMFEIKAMLSERVIDTVINNFGDREMFLFNKLLQDHPQIDEIDALSLIVPSVPGLAEQITKAVNDFEDELVGDSFALDLINKQ